MTGVAPLGQKKAVSRLGYETTDEEQRRNWCFSLWLRLAQPGVVITRHHYRVDPNSSIYALTRYEPGIWRSNRSGLTWSSVYLHNDHLGTLRYLSDSSGNPTSPTVFSAFGEQIGGATAEFGYAGAWGYRTAAYIAGPLHVGHRYYDPGSGRFLQRDPIGIEGGINSYAYAEGNPADSADPSGLSVGLLPGPPKKRWDPFDRQHPGGRPPKTPRQRRIEDLKKQREKIAEEGEKHTRRARRYEKTEKTLRKVRAGAVSVGVATVLTPSGPLGWSVAVGICVDLLLVEPDPAY